MKFNFSGIQQLGRALMLPIAVLPAAAILLRFGQEDLLNLPFMAAAGAAIFENLGILFAIGIAVGFAKENNGAAGLAGVVGYFVTIKGASTLLALPPEIAADGAAKVAFLAQAASRMSIPVGILSGLTAGILYNRFHAIQLPDYLSFFGGRRFVPIVTGVACLGWAFIFGESWPVLSAGLDNFSRLLSASGDVGLFLYGVLNRLLIVTGLHHILNNVVWFLHGSFTIIQDGIPTVITGDLNRFSRGDPMAGAFMAGFFPVMMFGLPAACLAMYRSALPTNRPVVGGMLLSMALTAFLTGITEPIEFTFMFLAPPLYAVHALLTGLSLVIMNVLDVKLGFGFSAGLIDYVINFSKSTHPLYLLPVGAIYFVSYYLLFTLVIRMFNLKTPGREASAEGETGTETVSSAGPTSSEQADPKRSTKSGSTVSGGKPGAESGFLSGTGFASPAEVAVEAGTEKVGQAYAGQVSQSAVALLAALGDAANVLSVAASETRVLLDLRNAADVDQNSLRALGAFGFARPSDSRLEIVFGPTAEMVASELRNALGSRAGSPDSAGSDAPSDPPVADSVQTAPLEIEAEPKIRDMILALGGPDNFESVDACATRLRLVLKDNKNVDDAKLKQLGAHGVVRPDGKSLQVVLGPVADTISMQIQKALHRFQSRSAASG